MAGCQRVRVWLASHDDQEGRGRGEDNGNRQGRTCHAPAVSDYALAVTLVVISAAAGGCGSSSLGSTSALPSACRAGTLSGWCSEVWSKSYSTVLEGWGFDKFVAQCPGDESGFYTSSARIPGKYNWYCASRAKYSQLPAKPQPLQLTGYYLSSQAEENSNFGQVQWRRGAFESQVEFNSDFYPLQNNECYVDFADPRVGGGVFRNGLAQEEKMFLQLPELLVVVGERNYNDRPLYLSSPDDGQYRNSDVLVFQEVERPVRAIPKEKDLECDRESAWPCENFVSSAPLERATVTVVAINAQEFHSDGFYSSSEFTFLLRKVLAAFAAAEQAGCTRLNSGPLGAGVFNGNLDLTVMLHASMAVAFNMPVRMWGFGGASTEVRTLVSWIEDSASVDMQTVLQKLKLGVSWGHGSGRKDTVQLDRSRWDAA